MAAGAAAAYSIFSGRQARRDAQELERRNTANEKAKSDESIRRISYTHKRDMATLEANLGALGLSDTKLRKDDEEYNKYNASITELEQEIADLGDYEGSGVIAGYDGMPDEAYWTPQDEKLLLDKEMTLASLKAKQGSPWSSEGGGFAKYFSELETVHKQEVDWMKETGLYGIEATRLQGQAAANTARAQERQGYIELAGSAYDWYRVNNTPNNDNAPSSSTDNDYGD